MAAGLRLRQVQPAYIHPVDQPKHKKVEEKISRQPDIRWEVFGVAILCAVFGSLIGWAMNGGSFQHGVGAAGIFGLIATVVQTWRLFGRPIILENTTEFQETQVVMNSRPVGIPVNRGGEQVAEVERRNEKTLRNDHYSYTFSGRQLDKLLDWHEKGVDTIRRERSGELPGFNELDPPIQSTTYTNVKKLLSDANFINDDNQWTRDGLLWLRTV